MQTKALDYNFTGQVFQEIMYIQMSSLCPFKDQEKLVILAMIVWQHKKYDETLSMLATEKSWVKKRI